MWVYEKRQMQQSVKIHQYWSFNNNSSIMEFPWKLLEILNTTVQVKLFHPQF